MTTHRPTRRVLTSSGRALTATAASSYVIGVQLGWTELLILAAGSALALMQAILFVIGKQNMSVQRRLEHNLVSVGDDVSATVVIVNNGRSPAAPTMIEERVGERVIEIPIPWLATGEQSSHQIELPTDRRGVVSIGPSRVTKRDPLNLLCRAAAHTSVDRLWVRPRAVPLASVPTGRARGIEGASSDSSPAGDVSFHALREYQVGDDPRHVHWLSSARTGTLMVRHHVDNRLPEIAIVLDTGADNWGGPRFDLAAEIAASVAVSSIANHLPASLRFTTDDEAVIDQSVLDGPWAGQATADEVLKALTLVEPEVSGSAAGKSLAAQIEAETAARPTCSLLVAITGNHDADEVAGIRRIAGTPPMILVRVGTAEQESKPEASVSVSSEPGFVALDVASLDEFQQAWNREMA